MLKKILAVLSADSFCTQTLLPNAHTYTKDTRSQNYAREQAYGHTHTHTHTYIHTYIQAHTGPAIGTQHTTHTRTRNMHTSSLTCRRRGCCCCSCGSSCFVTFSLGRFGHLRGEGGARAVLQHRAAVVPSYWSLQEEGMGVVAVLAYSLL